jgi:DNA-binding CsgD family transcriptional regulator
MKMKGGPPWAGFIRACGKSSIRSYSYRGLFIRRLLSKAQGRDIRYFLARSTFVSNEGKMLRETPSVFLIAENRLLRETSVAEVVSGVRAVLEAQAVCPLHLRLELFRTFSRQWTGFPDARIKLELGLTRRQQQVIPYNAQGLTNKEIASQLGISEHTIKNHIHEIKRQLGAGDRLQIVDLSNFSAPLR